MQFSIDVDTGAAITGWVALDNPGDVPVIIISADGHPPVELAANVNRPDLKDAGLHATGMAGFHIDGTHIPEIQNAKNISIREKGSGIELYTRFDIVENIERRVFIYSFGMLRYREMIRDMSKKFGSSYLNIERHSYETIGAILNAAASKSVICIGQPSYLRYGGALETQKFFKAALLCDPFEELAEKLLLLRLAAKNPTSPLYERHLSGLTPLLPIAEQLEFEREREIRLLFRGLSQEQRKCISNPVTRILACEIDEMPERRHVGLALDHLSKMDLVGTVSQFDTFRSMFNELLGSEVVSPSAPYELAPVTELAKRLSRISTVTQLIEHDLALYSYAEEAVLEGSNIPDISAAS